jgi:aminopeptidase
VAGAEKQHKINNRGDKMSKLEKSCKIIVSDCMGLEKRESCLIIADANKIKIAKAMFEASAAITPKTTLILTNIGKFDGEDPSAYVASEMKRYDVILIATTKSMTHTKARRDATDKGARIASMPGITEEMIARCICIDYAKMHKFGEKIKQRLSKASKVRITSAAGTDLNILIKGVRIDISDGIFTDAKAYGNLPDGEICMMPVHGTADGVFVIDASILNCMVDKPIKVLAEKGYAKDISGGSVAKKLKAILKKHGKDAFNIAEFAIGINPKAKLTGNVLEDEKVMGTVHIAFGNNTSFGGDVAVPLHLDGVMMKPTVYADGKIIMEDGRILLG